MKKITPLAVSLALVASTSFAGNIDVVAQEPIVMSDAIDDAPAGSLGGNGLWILVGGALVLAAVIATAEDDDSASGT